MFLTRLLFRAIIHGDKAITFHNLSDYKNNLLFLVKKKKIIDLEDLLQQV